MKIGPESNFILNFEGFTNASQMCLMPQLKNLSLVRNDLPYTKSL